MVRLEDVPVAGVHRLAEQRRALELVPDELSSLRGDHEEPNEVLVHRDVGVAAEDRLAEHRRPLDLEHERATRPDIPDAIDLLDVLGRTVADEWQIDGQFAILEPVAEPPTTELAALLPSTEPDAESEAVAEIGEKREELRVLLAPAEQVVGGDEPVGGRCERSIGRETGSDEGFVG